MLLRLWRLLAGRRVPVEHSPQHRHRNVEKLAWALLLVHEGRCCTQSALQRNSHESGQLLGIQVVRGQAQEMNQAQHPAPADGRCA